VNPKKTGIFFFGGATGFGGVGGGDPTPKRGFFFFLVAGGFGLGGAAKKKTKKPTHLEVGGLLPHVGKNKKKKNPGGGGWGFFFWGAGVWGWFLKQKKPPTAFFSTDWGQTVDKTVLVLQKTVCPPPHWFSPLVFRLFPGCGVFPLLPPVFVFFLGVGGFLLTLVGRCTLGGGVFPQPGFSVFLPRVCFFLGGGGGWFFFFWGGGFVDNPPSKNPPPQQKNVPPLFLHTTTKPWGCLGPKTNWFCVGPGPTNKTTTIRVVGGSRGGFSVGVCGFCLCWFGHVWVWLGGFLLFLLVFFLVIGGMFGGFPLNKNNCFFFTPVGFCLSGGRLVEPPNVRGGKTLGGGSPSEERGCFPDFSFLGGVCFFWGFFHTLQKVASFLGPIRQSVFFFLVVCFFGGVWNLFFFFFFFFPHPLLSPNQKKQAPGFIFPCCFFCRFF